MKRPYFLCKRCFEDPTEYEFSLASGHDYGRLKHFPKLSGMTLNTVTPVRNYNINITVRPNHAVGHSICFPSSGPIEAAKELPCHDITRLPQVTFLGPNDLWRKAQSKWRHLYEVKVDDAYNALRIWTQLRNPNFDGVEIVDTPEKRELLGMITDQVERDIICSGCPNIADMSAFVDEQDAEEARFDVGDGDDVHVDDSVEQSEVQRRVIHSAVLPKPSLATAGSVSAIQALLHIMKPDNNKDGEDELPQDEPGDGGMTQVMRDEIARQDRRRARRAFGVFGDDGEYLDMPASSNNNDSDDDDDSSNQDSDR